MQCQWSFQGKALISKGLRENRRKGFRDKLSKFYFKEEQRNKIIVARGRSKIMRKFF